MSKEFVRSSIQKLLTPEFENEYALENVQASIASSVWSQDTTTAFLPTKRKSLLHFRPGYTDIDLAISAIVMPILTNNAFTIVGSRKLRFAVYTRDYPFEISASLRGIPNNATPLFTTGAGITIDTARDAWSSVGAGANDQPMFRFDISGGFGFIPAGTAFMIACLSECAYTGAPAEAPTSGVYLYSSRTMAGLNKSNRLAAQIQQRPVLYINDLLGDGTATGIDEIDFASATAMNAKPIGDWTSFTDAQLDGTTHIKGGISGSLQTGGVLALTSGITIKSSLPWVPTYFLKAG